MDSLASASPVVPGLKAYNTTFSFNFIRWFCWVKELYSFRIWNTASQALLTLKVSVE